MWIARDKNDRVFLYYKKPKRRKNNWHEKGTPYLQMERTQFPDLKWEDNPIEVKLIPSAAEVIVLPSEEEISKQCDSSAHKMDIDDGETPNSGLYWRGWWNAVRWLKSKIVK